MLLFAFLLGIALLLFLILKLRIQAFLALLMSAMFVGVLAGLDAKALIQTVQQGMASTLGFVATVVGLGAMFGAILEHSGGTRAISDFLLKKLGEKKSPLALMLSGLIIAIPVFFDVAFIILVPLVYALQRKTKKSLLLYAIPLLSGLAIAHAFIPPTPGPVVVADMIGADIGWVILIGIITAIPTALVSGLWFGRHISKKIHVMAPEVETSAATLGSIPPVGSVFLMVSLPIVLIVLNTVVQNDWIPIVNPTLKNMVALLGHPFSALILANVLAWYFLGIRKGFTKKQLHEITTKSLAPAGTIILLTGAGGVFKQVLTDTGAGKVLATSLQELGFPILVFAFLAALLVRVIQGSATVAMITAAGLVAALLENLTLSAGQLACIVIAVASGASMLSHVNDSGFWLVSQYLGLNEKQTFRSWTMMTVWLGLVGFAVVSLLYPFF
ncbi:MAG: gluconate:H+ symporter [Flavobacteriaceae bacterium]|nr:gluconate:H+ symporter [Flavobacteriaceae bacterium]